MPYLQSFGHHLPTRIVSNDELAPLLAVDPDWIFTQSGIRERRYAAASDTVATLATAAAHACLAASTTQPSEIAMLLVASGSPDRYCPGPAAEIASALALPSGTPALDIPVGSAGALIALVLAARLAPSTGPILVVASEIMSRRITLSPEGKSTAMLFGDGAGAALIHPSTGFARIADTCLHTEQNEALSITGNAVEMDGAVVIRHATRCMPDAIRELLTRNTLDPAAPTAYLLHQANLNLLTRIAKSIGAPIACFPSNIDRYGNTSSASLLIAASEWRTAHPGPLTAPLILSAFGMGFNWGALLALPA